jgi:hypothetical protein
VGMEREAAEAAESVDTEAAEVTAARMPRILVGWFHHSVYMLGCLAHHNSVHKRTLGNLANCNIPPSQTVQSSTGAKAQAAEAAVEAAGTDHRTYVSLLPIMNILNPSNRFDIRHIRTRHNSTSCNIEPEAVEAEVASAAPAAVAEATAAAASAAGQSSVPKARTRSRLFQWVTPPVRSGPSRPVQTWLGFRCPEKSSLRE